MPPPRRYQSSCNETARPLDPSNNGYEIAPFLSVIGATSAALALRHLVVTAHERIFGVVRNVDGSFGIEKTQNALCSWLTQSNKFRLYLY